MLNLSEKYYLLKSKMKDTFFGTSRDRGEQILRYDINSSSTIIKQCKLQMKLISKRRRKAKK